MRQVAKMFITELITCETVKDANEILKDLTIVFCNPHDHESVANALTRLREIYDNLKQEEETINNTQEMKENEDPDERISSESSLVRTQ